MVELSEREQEAARLLQAFVDWFEPAGPAIGKQVPDELIDRARECAERVLHPELYGPAITGEDLPQLVEAGPRMKYHIEISADAMTLERLRYELQRIVDRLEDEGTLMRPHHPFASGGGDAMSCFDLYFREVTEEEFRVESDAWLKERRHRQGGEYG